MDVTNYLKVAVTLEGDAVVIRGLGAIGTAGEQSAQRVTSAFTKASASITKMSAPAVSFQRQMEETGNSVTRMTAPAVTGFKQLADAQDDAGRAAGTHGLSLGRLAMESGTFLGRLTGINPALTRFTAQLGGAVAGYGQIIALLGAVVAVSEAYKAWTVEADEAKKKQDDLTKSLLDWYDTQRDGGTFQLRKEIEATTKSVLDLQTQLDKLSQGKASGIGVIGQAPGGLFSSILRILSSGDVLNMTSQFATEIGKGTAKISDAITTGNDAIDAATKKLAETLNQNGIEVAKQTALNDAFNAGAYAAALINAAYEHRAALAQNAIGYTGAQLDQANKLTDALYAQKVRAAELTEAQRAMNETWANADKFMAQLSERLKNSQPEFAATALQYTTMAQQLTLAAAALAAAQNSRGTAGLGARNAASASTGLDASAANVQRQILRDTENTARAIEESVNAAVQLGEAFRVVDKNLGAIISSIAQIGANIKPLIEQIKAFKVPDGMGGNLGSALGVIGAASGVIGGIAGLATTLFSLGDAARQAKAAEEAMKQSIEQTTNAIRVQLGLMSNADAQIAEAEAERKRIDAEITASLTRDYVNAGNFSKSARDALQAAIDAAVGANDALYKALEESLKTTAAAADEAAKAQARLNNAQSQSNSRLRILNATGQSDAAFDLQQSLEIQQAIADGLDAISIGLLEDAQNAERAQREREKQTQILQDQLSAAQQQVQQLQQVYDSLDQFSKSLNIGQYSPLSPRQQLDAARGQLNTLYQAALGGDQNAAGQFSSVAQQFLDASRKYNASGAGYVLDFNSVQVMTDALKKQFGSSLTDAQKQVSLLQQQLDALNKIASGMDTLVSRPNLTPQVPTPTPVGGGVGTHLDVTSGGDDTAAVSRAGFLLISDKLDTLTGAIEDGNNVTARRLDTLTSATLRSA